MSRTLDLCVFGVGNAGRAVALQLIKLVAATRTTVGLAGRNRKRVEAARKSICDELGLPVTSAEIIIADAGDAASMDAMAAATSVLISCAGPYGRFGEASVVACIKNGTHYVDITGEVKWVNHMINKHGKAAEEAGVSLLPFSGYDCVPAELGLLISADAIGRNGGGLGSLELVFRSKGGGFPRGTLNTILDGIEGKGPSRQKGDAPFVPTEYRANMKKAIGLCHWLLPAWSTGQRQFTAPNFMAAVNVPVLYRAAGDLKMSTFRYSDRSAIGRGSRLSLCGLIPALIFQLVLIIGGFLLVMPCFRWWLKRKLNSYSYGGSAEGRVYMSAKAVSKEGIHTAKVDFMCPGDPGIYATGLMAASVAVALLKATSAGSENTPPAGFRSPGVALRGGGLLVKQLKMSGVEINCNLLDT